MRLWTLHPALLDAKGLVACWRETLLAQKVLAGGTAGYRDHPQLARLRATSHPISAVGFYLQGLWDAATVRGYRFDHQRIMEAGVRDLAGTVPVTCGQVEFERGHLLRKLLIRDPGRVPDLKGLALADIPVHPLFDVVDGPVEPWERDPLAASNQ